MYIYRERELYIYNQTRRKFDLHTFSKLRFFNYCLSCIDATVFVRNVLVLYLTISVFVQIPDNLFAESQRNNCFNIYIYIRYILRIFLLMLQFARCYWYKHIGIIRFS